MDVIFFKTRIYVYYHELAFSDSALSRMLLLASSDGNPPPCLPRVLVILFWYYLFICSFYYVLSVPISYSKCFCFLCVRFIVSSRSFFPYVLVDFFLVWKVLFCEWCLTLSWSYLCLPCLPIYLDLFPQVILVLIFSSQFIFGIFFFLCTVACGFLSVHFF